MQQDLLQEIDLVDLHLPTPSSEIPLKLHDHNYFSKKSDTHANNAQLMSSEEVKSFVERFSSSILDLGSTISEDSCLKVDQSQLPYLKMQAEAIECLSLKGNSFSILHGDAPLPL
jgi:hypothetical protein